MCVYTKMRPYVSNAESNKNETKNEQYLKINRTHSPSYPGQKMMLDVCCAHTHTCSTVEHFRPEPTDRPTDTRISYRRRFKNRIQLFEALCCSLLVCLKEDAIENTNCCIYSTIYFNNSVSLRLMNISLRCVPMPTISPMETIRARLCSRWLLRYRFTHLSFGMAFFTLSHSLSLSLPTHYRVHNMFVQEKWFEKSLNNGTEDRQHTPCKSIKQMDLLCSAKCKYK